MLKLLVKKQLTEVFKGYFYDAKKNKKRSPLGTAMYFVLFAFLMLGILGGMFAYLSVSICGALCAAGVGWLYFALMGGIAIILGAFGSIFSTYSGLYLSKDNDLLLSMPIPVKYIIASRLLNVYIMGTMYSALVVIPALIVYWVIFGITAGKIICGILFFFIVSSIVMILSCLLGWCVAKISLKLKRKSFVTVFLSLLFIAAYYVVYFKASEIIRDLIARAEIYGEKVKSAVPFIYAFGRVPEASLKATLAGCGTVILLLFVTWLILKKTFLSIATASEKRAKSKNKGVYGKEKSPFRALLEKELSKFVSSPNYMLNCGLGIVIIPVLGVLLIVKGADIAAALESVFESSPDSVAVLFAAMLFMTVSMIDSAAPSVSLEGKNVWVLQSLPVKAKTVLASKTAVQMILSFPPVIFTAICGVAVIKASVAVKILILAVTVLGVVFMSFFDTFIGIMMPNMNWTNEIVPIKQSGAVMVALFGGWAFAIVFGALYLLWGYKAGAVIYLCAWTAVFAAASAVLARLINTKGAKRFEEL